MNAHSRVRPYLESGAVLLPAMLVWFGASLFIAPKIEHSWAAVGLLGQCPTWLHWLLQSSRFSVDQGAAVLLLAAALLGFAEWRLSGWSRHRRAVLLCATVLFNAAALFGLFFFVVSAAVTLPIVARL